MDKFIEKKIFNSEELNLFREYIKKLNFSKSFVIDSTKKIESSTYRTSTEAIINLDETFSDLILSKLSQYGIKSLPSKASILQYNIGNEFKKHIDNGYPNVHRYKTIIIQLSNFDEYDGGNLDVFVDNKKITANKSIGNTIIFNSSLKHTATKITKGVRYCMVFWLEKKHFGFNESFI